MAAKTVAPRPTAVAVGIRSNGTPRQLVPIAAAESAPGRIAGADARSAMTESARAFLRANRALLRLDDPDTELVPVREVADDLGGSHIRFSQTWQGLTVWPSEVIVHLDARGNVELVVGAFAPTPRRIPRRPVIDAQRALRIAGGNGTPPELIVLARNGRRPRLAWKTTVSQSLSEQWIVVIDAMTGATLQKFNNVKFASVNGSGVDLSGTTRQLKLWQSGSSFYLLDTSKQMFDPTSAPPNPNSTRGGIFVSDFSHGDSIFSLVSSNSATSWPVRDSVSAAFWLSQTYDYFLQNHGRDSIDGRKGTLTAAVRFKNAYENAFWVDEQQLMVFGDGDSYAGSLDVIAHEMAHGVTSHSANLVYEGQSGAINEAMSDIFGEMAEAKFYGDNDWQIGSHISGAIRSMSDPGRFGDPGKMSNFVRTTDDNGGVHTNSGIINRAFYLLAEGMSGAIGRRDAERIFYRALTQHLTKDSQFIDARLAAIASANELFGASSNQAQKTAAAFDAVEIFSAAPTPEEPSIPVVNAPDATLFLYLEDGTWRVGRREGNDPVEGVQLALDAAESRPAVTGDGTVAVYVDNDRDVCLTLTNGSGAPSCADFPSQGIFVSSVGISPDGTRFGFVLLGEDDEPENRIVVVDLENDTTDVYDLSTPAFDGESLAYVSYADVMTFSADGQFLVYDALNEVLTSSGETFSAWSIYALDLVGGEPFAIIPVIEGLDVGYPSLGHTSDNLLAFEAYDPVTDEVTVLAADLAEGEIRTIGTDHSIPTSPSYSGDDRAIVYAVTASNETTGANLVRQALSGDKITPSGARTTWIASAAYPSMYRRGTYSGPTTTAGTLSFASPSYNVNEGSTVTITVLRSGGNMGPASVSYATSNQTATAGSDYAATSGTLTWADGEAGAKTFFVTALSDSANEGNEIVRLSLTGSNVGTPSTATLTIANQAPSTGRRRAARH